ncbi:C6 transcription factor [Phlyctema vagabunda]|uniref:C6 transcription factor n=1 Tax=Phlyctema vagabunda TaxID=108571 RepID=A0ABR4P2T7_9HELO
MTKSNAPRMAEKKVENTETLTKGKIAATLSGLQANSELWYKVGKVFFPFFLPSRILWSPVRCTNFYLWIRVLLHDLSNIANDRAAEARTLCTTDELYISAPYFTPEEAALIKATVISPPKLNEIPEFEALELEFDTSTEIEEEEGDKVQASPDAMTIEEAIKSCLQNFFEKRRASGDARPCGPHDMSPIYNTVFGITKEELRDPKFLGRLRRAGLGQPIEKAVSEEGKSKQKKKGGKK